MPSNWRPIMKPGQARDLLEDLLADPDLDPDVRAAAQKLQAQLQ